jgi:uridylate kinase
LEPEPETLFYNSCLRGVEIHADVILKGTTSVYDSDPEKMQTLILFL